MDQLHFHLQRGPFQRDFFFFSKYGYVNDDVIPGMERMAKEKRGEANLSLPQWFTFSSFQQISDDSKVKSFR